MPGPKAERPTAPRAAEFTRPNKRAAARLKARQDATPRGSQFPGFNIPGSQNRSK